VPGRGSGQGHVDEAAEQAEALESRGDTQEGPVGEEDDDQDADESGCRRQFGGKERQVHQGARRLETAVRFHSFRSDSFFLSGRKEIVEMVMARRRKTFYGDPIPGNFGVILLFVCDPY